MSTSELKESASKRDDVCGLCVVDDRVSAVSFITGMGNLPSDTINEKTEIIIVNANKLQGVVSTAIDRIVKQIEEVQIKSKSELSRCYKMVFCYAPITIEDVRILRAVIKWFWYLSFECCSFDDENQECVDYSIFRTIGNACLWWGVEIEITDPVISPNACEAIRGLKPSTLKIDGTRWSGPLPNTVTDLQLEACSPDIFKWISALNLNRFVSLSLACALKYDVIDWLKRAYTTKSTPECIKVSFDDETLGVERDIGQYDSCLVEINGYLIGVWGKEKRLRVPNKGFSYRVYLKAMIQASIRTGKNIESVNRSICPILKNPWDKLKLRGELACHMDKCRLTDDARMYMCCSDDEEKGEMVLSWTSPSPARDTRFLPLIARLVDSILQGRMLHAKLNKMVIKEIKLLRELAYVLIAEINFPGMEYIRIGSGTCIHDIISDFAGFHYTGILTNLKVPSNGEDYTVYNTKQDDKSEITKMIARVLWIGTSFADRSLVVTPTIRLENDSDSFADPSSIVTPITRIEDDSEERPVKKQRLESS